MANRLMHEPYRLGNSWESNGNILELIESMEEILRDIRSSVRTLQKKADLPDFGSVAVVSFWKN